MSTPYIPTARARCIVCNEHIGNESCVPVMLTTTAKGKSRYAHCGCLNDVTHNVPPMGNGPIYDGLTYGVVLTPDNGKDNDALAAALLNTKQKAVWVRTPNGYEVSLNNLKSHRVFETIAERCTAATLECRIYHYGNHVDTVSVRWANRGEGGRWLKKSQRADAKRCEFLILIDKVTEPIKRYSNYPEL